MKVFIDTDVLLDVALTREPFVGASAEMLRWAENNRRSAGLAEHSLATVYYMVRRELSESESREWMSDILRNLTVAPLDHGSALRALASPIPDYEDALLAEAALIFGADHIITRNLKHFRKSPVPAKTPDGFLRKIAKEG